MAIAQGEPEQAERDAHDALARAAEIEAYLVIPDILECLAALAGDAGSHREAARLFGAAHAIRQRMGAVRFKVWDAGYEASVAALRDAMGEKDFDSAWAEGAALSTEEAIAYAQRGRGQRKRPDQRLGIAHPDRARRRPTGQRRAGQQRHRRKAFRLTAHRANPPHPRLHQTRPDLPRAARPRSGPPQLTPRGVRNAGDESCCAVLEANPKGYKGGLAVTTALTKHIADRRVSDDWSELILREPPGIRNTIGVVASGSVVSWYRVRGRRVREVTTGGWRRRRRSGKECWLAALRTTGAECDERSY